MAMEGIRCGWRCFSLAFRREVRKAFRQPEIHWITWCFPLILFGLIGSNFSEGTLLELPVAVVDNDHSPLSRELIRKLDAGPHAQLEVPVGGLAEAKQRMSSAQDYAMLYIPRDFEADTLGGRQPQVVLFYNALFYGAGLYATQDFPGLMAEMNGNARSYVTAMTGKTLPALPQVTLSYDSLFNASGSYIYYQQFSATIHLLQLFVVTCMIYVLARSKPLLYSSSFSMALLGKLAPYTLIYTTLLMGELGLLVWIFDARMVGNPFYMLAVGFCYVIAAQSIGMLLYTFTRSAITAYTLVGILVGAALTFSGTVMPELSMPLFAQIFANLEPLTHALYAMFGIFLRQVPGKPIIEVCALLMIYPLVAAILIRNRLTARLRMPETLQ
ncbi:ABC transporter permease [Shimwellia pseudoproteus]|uniref:ABC transporter permease n=1 Tax=Shimwellia pseudoproteus TaxID=570012 RepID=UPI0018EABDFA|nr:ABC transporter permease [Shimwellia pseudoproteus]MBJ3815795.1 ABC transporter permease [Shimwellia pseudoproteus]